MKSMAKHAKRVAVIFDFRPSGEFEVYTTKSTVSVDRLKQEGKLNRLRLSLTERKDLLVSLRENKIVPG